MRSLLIITAFLCIMAACSHDPMTDRTQPYRGNWELRVADGFAGKHTYEPGNGDMLHITADSFIRTNKGEQILKIRYRLSLEANPWFSPPEVMDKVINRDNPDTAVKFFINVRNDTLTQYYGVPAADGGYASYVRIN